MPRSQLSRYRSGNHRCGKLVAERRALVRQQGFTDSAPGQSAIDAELSTPIDVKQTFDRQFIHAVRCLLSERQGPAAAAVALGGPVVIDSSSTPLPYCCYPNQNIRVKEPRSPRPAKSGHQPRRKGLAR
jgi:hypothetical protein